MLRFNKAIVYSFDPIASFSFEPALIYLGMGISSVVMPEIITTWTIGVNPVDDLLACGVTIQRGQPLDTVERCRATVDQFIDRQ